MKVGPPWMTGDPLPGDLCHPHRRARKVTVAARTIPFPHPPGTAAAKHVTPTLPPTPPTGAAKLIQAPRRYRGLHLVSDGCIRRISHQVNSLAQTQAIVAQVEREIEQRTARARMGDQPRLLTAYPGNRQTSTSGAARRLVQSFFPAGL